MTTQSWRIEMADLPADVAEARVLSAPFCGLSMVQADGGYPDTFFAVLAVADGQLPVEVTANAFGLLAALATSAHEGVVVLSRKSAVGPFGAVGLFGAQDALTVVEKLRGQG